MSDYDDTFLELEAGLRGPGTNLNVLGVGEKNFFINEKCTVYGRTIDDTCTKVNVSFMAFVF